jgi:hypothetical protein
MISRGLIICGILAILFGHGHAQQVTITTILDKSDKVMRPDNLKGAFEITLISKNNAKRIIKARAYQKLLNTTRTDRLFLITFPPPVRDTGLLVHSHMKSDEDKMWIYLPAVKKIKRIALDTAGGGYFMGSDFTYSDLVSKSRDEYRYALIGQKKIGGEPCYEIRAEGKDKARKKKYGYSKEIQYYRKKDFVLIKIIYYDLAGELLKVYSVDQVKVMGAYLYPTKVRMENKQTGHRSIINFTELSVPKDIPGKYFTFRYLQSR